MESKELVENITFRAVAGTRAAISEHARGMGITSTEWVRKTIYDALSSKDGNTHCEMCCHQQARGDLEDILEMLEKTNSQLGRIETASCAPDSACAEQIKPLHRTCEQIADAQSALQAKYDALEEKLPNLIADACKQALTEFVEDEEQGDAECEVACEAEQDPDEAAASAFFAEYVSNSNPAVCIKDGHRFVQGAGLAAERAASEKMKLVQGAGLEMERAERAKIRPGLGLVGEPTWNPE